MPFKNQKEIDVAVSGNSEKRRLWCSWKDQEKALLALRLFSEEEKKKEEPPSTADLSPHHPPFDLPLPLPTSTTTQAQGANSCGVSSHFEDEDEGRGLFVSWEEQQYAIVAKRRRNSCF